MDTRFDLSEQLIPPAELVSLVKKDKVDIHSISISSLLQKWIEAVDNRESFDALFAIFNAVAVLMTIKLYTLLPTVEVSDDTDEVEKPEREEDTDWIYTLRDELQEKERYASRLFSRPLIAPEKVFGDVDPNALYRLAEEIIAKYKARPSIELQKETIDVNKRRREIEREISKKGRMNLRTVLERQKSLLGMIVTFAVVLEIAKQGKIRLSQRTPFGSVWVEWKRVGR
jgi:chromatin segregation and condensation protein Rec8/ScpA/Scc1 (kleisin family)